MTAEMLANLPVGSLVGGTSNEAGSRCYFLKKHATDHPSRHSFSGFPLTGLVTPTMIVGAYSDLIVLEVGPG